MEKKNIKKAKVNTKQKAKTPTEKKTNSREFGSAKPGSTRELMDNLLAKGTTIDNTVKELGKKFPNNAGCNDPVKAGGKFLTHIRWLQKTFGITIKEKDGVFKIA